MSSLCPISGFIRVFKCIIAFYLLLDKDMFLLLLTCLSVMQFAFPEVPPRNSVKMNICTIYSGRAERCLR